MEALTMWYVVQHLMLATTVLLQHCFCKMIVPVVSTVARPYCSSLHTGVCAAVYGMQLKVDTVKHSLLYKLINRITVH
jgi:hypothetical protein